MASADNDIPAKQIVKQNYEAAGQIFSDTCLVDQTVANCGIPACARGCQHKASKTNSVIDNISKAKLTNENRRSIGSSRPKYVYLFGADGSPVAKPQDAAYMIDTCMDEDEVGNYALVRQKGIRVPSVYAQHEHGPIVQFLPNQTTVTGQLKGIAKGVESTISRQKMINKFNSEAWKKALVDLDKLISAGYHSPDLQFMIDNNGSGLYVMDMEKDKAPYFDESPDEGLKDAKEHILRALGQ